ncbi:hypothetical protein LR002_02300 [Candidatus Gracilibacteria bacterium]|nr:hypothetical protein [Candidatus Gracilibacteria bacterium]
MNKLESFFLKRQLDEDEEVIHIVHKHWIDFVGPVFKWSILGIFIPGFLVWLYPQYYSYIVFGFLFVAVMAIYDFFDWYLDTLTLTDYGIVHYQWDGFFKSSSSRMEYESIEDISFELSGILSSIFDFGDLHIERPAGEILFKHTANPKEAELKILEARKISRIGGINFGEGQEIDKEGLKSLLGEIISERLEKNGNNGVKKNGFRRN